MADEKYNQLLLSAERLVRAVETVFDADWDYTKSMLGVAEDDAADYEGDGVVPSGTFLKPTDRDLAVDNWGNYEILLDRYHELKTLLATLSERR